MNEFEGMEDNSARAQPDPAGSNEASVADPNLKGNGVHKPYTSPRLSPYEQSLLDSDPDPRSKLTLANVRDPHYPLTREREVHRLIQILAAQGYTDKEIAAKVDRSTVCVSNVRRQPWAANNIVEMQHKFGVNEVAEIFKGAKVKAAQVADKILTQYLDEARNPDGSLAVSATAAIATANSVHDRVYGKAKTPFDTEGLDKLDLASMPDDELMKRALGNLN